MQQSKVGVFTNKHTLATAAFIIPATRKVKLKGTERQTTQRKNDKNLRNKWKWEEIDTGAMTAPKNKLLPFVFFARELVGWLSVCCWWLTIVVAIQYSYHHLYLCWQQRWCGCKNKQPTTSIIVLTTLVAQDDSALEMNP